MKRWLKIAAITASALLLLGFVSAAWFLTRTPPPAKIYAAGSTGERITEDDLFANYFPAPGTGKKPGILLLGGSEGGLARNLLLQAKLLQQEGYNVLHLAYHNAPGKPAHLANVPLEEFQRGLHWLKTRPEVDSNSIAIVGYSKGAEAALLTATRHPDIKAVVAGMPSSVAWDGLDSLSILFGINSSWSEDGDTLPSLDYGSFDSERGIYSVFEDGLKNVAENPDAVIPVEQITGAVLLICGERDALWPSCAMAEQIITRAAKAGQPPAKLLRYADAGHGVMGAPLPATDPDIEKFAELGGTAEANAKARADSWPKILAFLRSALTSE